MNGIPTTVAGSRSGGGRPSICFVAPNAYPVMAGRREIQFVGGAEVQQCLIARELSRRGYHVSMISVDFGQAEGEVVAGVYQIKAYSVASGITGFRFLHPRLTSMWAAMRRADADIYYHRTRGMTIGLVAAFCKANARRSVYSAAHDVDFSIGPASLKYARDRAMYNWGMRNVDQIIVQSERQRLMCLRRYNREAMVIRSCYSHRGSAAEFGGQILWCATAKPYKQPHLFLDLAARLPQFQFCLVGGAGDGHEAVNYFEDLERRARTLPNVKLTGFVPYADVERYFDGASIFVNTSIGEGFPNTFLQAWSRGTPTVSFFDPQTSLDGRPVGRVVSTIDEMARAITELRCDPGLWREEGQRARELVERQYSMSGVGDAYEQIIAELGQSNAAAARATSP